eukprot:TRINITY_DN55757_c0_g1_i1.p1 TRINITY_DN55757_c0_g1~~TRINITY_DN55757_c0_g1_i1.p1  ORF type:complete len:141 (+),score=17.24 TRINITY_DN55757_c0_g1_i1:231-653(+)
MLPQDNGDEFFDRLVGSFFPMMGPGGASRSFNSMSRGFAPRMDLQELNDRYVISADVPGMPKSSVNVTVNNDLVCVEGSRDLPTQEDSTYLTRERFRGTFTRCFRLESVKESDISAKLSDGVLRVDVPKQTAQKNFIRVH